MDDNSFKLGVEEGIRKSAFFQLPALFAKFMGQTVQKGTELYQSGLDRVAAPAVAGWSDKNYNGLIKYDPETRSGVADMPNVRKTVFNGLADGPPERKPYNSWIDQAAYTFGQTGMGKKFIENRAGGAGAINKRIADTSHGVFSANEQGKLQMDREQIPSYLLSKARTWIDTNPGKAIGILGGLGAGAIGIGALMGSGESKKVKSPITPPPAQGGTTKASPGPVQPAPYAGRDGYMFTQANKV